MIFMYVWRQYMFRASQQSSGPHICLWAGSVASETILVNINNVERREKMRGGGVGGRGHPPQGKITLSGNPPQFFVRFSLIFSTKKKHFLSSFCENFLPNYFLCLVLWIFSPQKTFLCVVSWTFLPQKKTFCAAVFVKFLFHNCFYEVFCGYSAKKYYSLQKK